MNMLPPHIPFAQFGQSCSKFFRLSDTCNILVVGDTGAGKSTLIRRALDVSVRQEITRGISRAPYRNIRGSVSIYDSEGLERRPQKVKKDILQFLKNKKQSNLCKNQIHLVWYCLNYQNANREGNLEVDWIKELANYAPVMLVVTRSPRNKESYVEQLISQTDCNLKIDTVVRVCAEAETYDEILEAHGLDRLCEASEKVLNDRTNSLIQEAIGSMKMSAVKWIGEGAFLRGLLGIIPGTSYAGIVPLVRNRILKRMFGGVSSEFHFNCIEEDLAAISKWSLLLETSAVLQDKLSEVDWQGFNSMTEALQWISESIKNFADSFLLENEMFSNLSDTLSKWAKFSWNLPFDIHPALAIFFVVETAFMASAWMQVLEEAKLDFYEGNSDVNLKSRMDEKLQQMLDWMTQWIPQESSESQSYAAT
ncbi:GTPase domain-containing protein [Leptolyngbya sp. O-77]|uniref:GTPase domain-containing protein n=1 Tax=Leptolyngbya sp. O-77 TaxID=1080068 RepID=UPI00074D348A|nr:GTPase domain-containing protein [Leptolyngbya sp. O-77]BAU42680.1 hypothetical protein O77CONTIG1_02502 [Leptolyngbya sp. O-77]